MRYEKDKIAIHNKSKKEWSIWAEGISNNPKNFGKKYYYGSPLKNGVKKGASRTFLEGDITFVN